MGINKNQNIDNLVYSNIQEEYIMAINVVREIESLCVSLKEVAKYTATTNSVSLDTLIEILKNNGFMQYYE